MAEKFETIQDARDFINGQLINRGFLKSGQSLSVNGESDDTKLVINTINKLLRTIRAKDDQLSEWHAKLQREQRQAPQPTVTPTVPHRVSRRSRGAMISKRNTVKRALDDDNVRRMFKVRANKLQSTVDELRDRIHRDNTKLRDADVTWQVHQDLTTPQVAATPPEDDLDDQLTLLLHRQSSQQELSAELVVFLDNVNRFTYSSAILGIAPVSLREQRQEVLDRLQSSGDHTVAPLIEFINDWYQIIDLEAEPRDRADRAE